ncbi:MAG: GNAT family N-acetyltransferase [Candidatus Limnocylindrales bacterium]
MSDACWVVLADAPVIDGLRFRRPRRDTADYEAMASVIQGANTHDGVQYLPTAAILREEIEASAQYDLLQDVVLAEIQGQAIASAGAERVVRDGVAVHEIWGHVDPAWRHRGIGRALLGENLRRAAERGDAEPAGRRVEARAHVEESQDGHRHLLETTGFDPIRWYFDMRRPNLEDIPGTPLPDGLIVRPVSADQHRAIWDADNEAFMDHWQPRVRTDEGFASLFAAADLDTSLWVVAWDGDQIAGVVQSWIWKDENAQLGVQRGWLEHISVRSPWRRRGLGQAITAEALRRLRAAGMHEAMLGVDADSPTGALRLYERLGFQIHSRSTAYRLILAR